MSLWIVVGDSKPIAFVFWRFVFADKSVWTGYENEIYNKVGFWGMWFNYAVCLFHVTFVDWFKSVYFCYLFDFSIQNQVCIISISIYISIGLYPCILILFLISFVLDKLQTIRCDAEVRWSCQQKDVLNLWVSYFSRCQPPERGKKVLEQF